MARTTRLRLTRGSAAGWHPRDGAARGADGESPSSTRARQIFARSMEHGLESDWSVAEESYLCKKKQAQR